MLIIYLNPQKTEEIIFSHGRATHICFQEDWLGLNTRSFGHLRFEGILESTMNDLPIDLQAAIFGCLDDDDRASLMLANPMSWIDGYKICPRIKFVLHDKYATQQAVDHFASMRGTDTLSLVSDSLYLICMFLQKVEPVRLQKLSICIRNFTAMDGLYCTDILCDLEGTVDAVDISISTLDDDDISTFVLKTCRLMHAARSVRIEYLLGTLSMYHLVLPKARAVELRAARISKSVWGTRCPELRDLTVRGSIAKCRQTGVQSEHLLRGASLDTMDIDIDNQIACDLLLHLMRNTERVDALIIRYAMPVCLARGVPSVKNLRLHSTYNMALDLVYPVMVEDWTQLQEIVVTKGMEYPCLFTVRFLETSQFDIQDVMRTLAERWVLRLPNCVNVEIDRF